MTDPDLDVPKRWFRENVGRVLSVYGQEHAVQKEDLMLGMSSDALSRTSLICGAVIGTLDAANYALFVSHYHPDGQVSAMYTTRTWNPLSSHSLQVNFDIFSSSRPGQPWGELTTSSDMTASTQGPIYREELSGSASGSKVSLVKNSLEQWDTVLVARLRFAPDKDEPTSK